MVVRWVRKLKVDKLTGHHLFIVSPAKNFHVAKLPVLKKVGISTLYHLFNYVSHGTISIRQSYYKWQIINHSSILLSCCMMHNHPNAFIVLFVILHKSAIDQIGYTSHSELTFSIYHLKLNFSLNKPFETFGLRWSHCSVNTEMNLHSQQNPGN